MSELEDRKVIARALLSEGTEPLDLELKPVLEEQAALTADLGIPFPVSTPDPQPIDPEPGPDEPLPAADVIVITWTVAELNALADVLTPGRSRDAWYRYRRRFADHYRPLIRRGAPALAAERLGSYFLTQVGPQRVLCFKSELHLNQDGIATGDGTATLPVRDLFAQLIDEVQPKVILSVGTSGGTSSDQDLGDVVVTRAARFRCQAEFRSETWNNTTFTSDWSVPTEHFAAAEELMRRFTDELNEPSFGPPTARYGFEGPLLESQPPNQPNIHLDGREFAEFHPVLTTDFFEFGTSTNSLDQHGCAVEMGDAVLGLVCEELDDPPRWAIVRNISDPEINGLLPTEPRRRNMQTHWAVWYYEAYGYWTSVTGALATWAIIAGLGEA